MAGSTLSIRCWFAVLVGFVFSFSAIPSASQLSFDPDPRTETVADSAFVVFEAVAPQLSFTNGTQPAAVLESHHSELIEESEEEVYESYDFPLPPFFATSGKCSKVHSSMISASATRSTVTLPLRC